MWVQEQYQCLFELTWLLKTSTGMTHTRGWIVKDRVAQPCRISFNVYTLTVICFVYLCLRFFVHQNSCRSGHATMERTVGVFTPEMSLENRDASWAPSMFMSAGTRFTSDTKSFHLTCSVPRNEMTTCTAGTPGFHI